MLIRRLLGSFRPVTRSTSAYTPAQHVPFALLPTQTSLRSAMSSNASDIKEIEVLDASELQDGQHKAVDFDGGKVLVSKVHGEVYATSAFCTHYGAPLEKGVMSHDGRVVCPWHGACFSVKTGDIEDAPGLDSLWSYSASIKNGKIVVKASEKEVKSKVGRIVSKSRSPKDHTKEKVVIVGGGSGGIHTVESLRMVSSAALSQVYAKPSLQNQYQGEIVLISEEDYAPIDR